MKTLATIRGDALAALRSNRGWRLTVGACAAWFGIELVANQLLGGLLMLCPLLVLLFYYLRFAKEYGTTALSIAVIRGAPTFSCAFMGFGCGWRTVGIHLRIGWKLVLPALVWFLPFLLFAVWFCGNPQGAQDYLASGVWPWVKANFPMSAVEFAVVALAAFLPTVMAWYHYRLAYNVFVDHPDWSGEMVLAESRRLMTGRRGRMFLLDLWFVAIYVAAISPAVWGLVGTVIDFTQNPDLLDQLTEALRAGGLSPSFFEGEDMQQLLRHVSSCMVGMFVFNLFNALYLQPYWTTVRAAFYEHVLDIDEVGGAREPKDGDFRPEGASAV